MPNWYFVTCLQNAKSRKLNFELTRTDLSDLFIKQSGLCQLSSVNIKFNPVRLESRSHCRNTTASLDRIDKLKGYVNGNVRWIHKHIKISKLDYTDDDYIGIARDIFGFDNRLIVPLKTYVLEKAVWGLIKSKINGRKNPNRMLEFSKEYLENIYMAQGGLCYLSGKPIIFANCHYGFQHGEQTASIDRIDTSKGYVEGNIQLLHKDVSMMKQSFTNQYVKTLFSAVYLTNKRGRSNEEDKLLSEYSKVINPPSKTIFIDADGTICYHYGNLKQMLARDMKILPNVRRMFKRWENAECIIVITTARPEWARQRTEEQLAVAGIKYNQLIMDMTAGERWLINDDKPDMPVTARAFTIDRNTGLRPLLNTNIT